MMSDDMPAGRDVRGYLVGMAVACILCGMPWCVPLIQAPVVIGQIGAFLTYMAIGLTVLWIARRSGMRVGPAMLGIPFLGCFFSFWILLALSYGTKVVFAQITFCSISSIGIWCWVGCSAEA